MFAKQLKDRFVAQADATDKRFADDQYVVIEKGRLVLKRRPSKVSPKHLDKLDKAAILASSGLVILEHAAGGRLPEESGSLQLVDRRRYGEAGFGFYRCREV